MKRWVLLSIFITSLSFVNCISQTTQNSTIIEVNKELKGFVIDIDSHSALPYANIYVLNKNKGAISNEKGYFSLNITNLDKTDTLRFQYIGYKTKNIAIGELDSSGIVYLKEDIFNLSETFIFGNKLNAEEIVKKILKNKEANYKKTTTKNQTFIRERYTSDFDEIKLSYKKSSFAELDRDLLDLIEEKMPKNSTSYRDFLGNLYFSENEDDSINFKIDPIKTVSLKEKDIAELKQIKTIFENIFTNTKEKEYWKIKSGIFGQKIDMDDENDRAENDSLKENERKIKHFNRRIKYRLNYSLLDNKNDWEFLHSTGKYRYVLAGGTSVAGEEVYIIDFKPKSSGEFIGRMYISMSTFALIRADYEYAPEKTGKDFHLLGVGYTEDEYSGSIYFEKKDSTYSLKYFSKKEGSYVTFDRSIALLKKRKRFLFDKTLNEAKVGVEVSLRSEQSFELLVLKGKEILKKQFTDFEEKKVMEIVYVDQFDDKLWKGYSIIEPTKQMREYKKQEVVYNK